MHFCLGYVHLRGVRQSIPQGHISISREIPLKDPEGQKGVRLVLRNREHYLLKALPLFGHPNKVYIRVVHKSRRWWFFAGYKGLVGRLQCQNESDIMFMGCISVPMHSRLLTPAQPPIVNFPDNPGIWWTMAGFDLGQFYLSKAGRGPCCRWVVQLIS